MIELRRLAVRLRAKLDGHGRQRGVIGCDLAPVVHVKPARQPLHLRVPPRPVGKITKLAHQVPRVEPGKARRQVAVALPAGAVTGRTGGIRPRFPAAEGNQLAAAFEGVCSGRRGAGRDGNQGRSGRQKTIEHHCAQASSTPLGSRLRNAALVAGTFALLAACKPPPEGRHDFTKAEAERGRALAISSGCAACHAFPDIAWPKGRAGPSLAAFDGRGPIAGTLPNTPDQLTRFVRNAPAEKPGSPMPAMPLSPDEARAIAAYLYGLADDQ